MAPSTRPLTIKMPSDGTLKTKRTQIPASHRDLLDGPYLAALTTVMHNGQPQTTPVWCNREGDYVLFNTMRGFLKEKNMRADPRVSLMVYDPSNPLRYIELEGLVIEMTEEGAVEHNDVLTRLYSGNPAAHFFGDAVPSELSTDYHPVKVTIAPIRVRVEGSNIASDTAIPVTFENKILTPPVAIAQSHQDLLLRPIYGVLATMLPDGQPCSSLVWPDYDGTEVYIHTTLESQECQNVQTNPKVTLLIVDPQDTSRYLEVRGQAVEIITRSALDQANILTKPYSDKEYFYSKVYPVEQQQPQNRVIVRITPLKVTHDAFFNRTSSNTELN